MQKTIFSNLRLYFFQRVEIVVSSSNVNIGNDGNVKLAIAIFTLYIIPSSHRQGVIRFKSTSFLCFLFYNFLIQK